MHSSVAPDFWERYNRLPPAVQARARKQYQLWLENHWHPSLHFKRVGPFWSVRVDENYRALGIEKDGTIVWFFIGRHSDYESKI